MSIVGRSERSDLRPTILTVYNHGCDKKWVKTLKLNKPVSYILT